MNPPMLSPTHSTRGNSPLPFLGVAPVQAQTLKLHHHDHHLTIITIIIITISPACVCALSKQQDKPWAAASAPVTRYKFVLRHLLTYRALPVPHSCG